MSPREKSCGAIVVRHTQSGWQVLLVRHNAGHWGFPKGHTEDGETEAQTALREIHEETGLTVQLDPGFRRSVAYSPREGVEKQVVYFLAEPLWGEERPQLSEVAALRWCAFVEAGALITYENDRSLLAEAAAYIAGQ
jgi:8-oxo-dGTP pyrophosphatase MutT (NUDIX family)